MKEVVSLAMNVSAIVNGDKLRPFVEAVLVLSEPVYSFDPSGQLVKTRTIDALRFSTSPEGLRSMAETFRAWADEAEEQVSECIAAACEGVDLKKAAEKPA